MPRSPSVRESGPVGKDWESFNVVTWAREGETCNTERAGDLGCPREKGVISVGHLISKVCTVSSDIHFHSHFHIQSFFFPLSVAVVGS